MGCLRAEDPAQEACNRDNVCEPGEDYLRCPDDCYRTDRDPPVKALYQAGENVLGMYDGNLERCGDGICDLRENWRSCSDCTVSCGDGTLDADEEVKCRQDMVRKAMAEADDDDVEIDGRCDTQESVRNNPEDCSPVQIVFEERTCPNEVCDDHENADNCPEDCGPGCGDRCCFMAEIGVCERDCPTGTLGESPDSVECNPPVCGNMKLEPGEGCDDGNKDDHDGCPSGDLGGCKAPAVCGDEIVFTGVEECEKQGALDNTCTADCEAVNPDCGNNIIEGDEICDDGNIADDDACPGTDCMAAATCGDGFVWTDVEGCDDGNKADDDECPSGQGMCARPAECGDGFVWSGEEPCDDGNEIETDACRVGCVLATCGDGVVQTGVEECDDGNTNDKDDCSNACANPRWVFIMEPIAPNGNLGGITGADMACQQAALDARLPGTYMAWLTGGAGSSAPVTRFASTEFVGWYRDTSGGGIAEGWSGLTTAVDGNYLQTAIRRRADKTGLPTNNNPLVWTNTNPDGSQRDPGTHCSDWMSDVAAGMGHVGQSSAQASDMPLSERWTDVFPLTCGVPAWLYCFQVG